MPVVYNRTSRNSVDALARLSTQRPTWRIVMPTENRTCQNCGNQFSFKSSASRGLRGKFCSRQCRRQAKHTSKACEYCGKRLVLMKSRADKRYCGRDCYFAARVVPL